MRVGDGVRRTELPDAARRAVPAAYRMSVTGADDPELTDSDLEREIALVGDLVLAAAGHDERMSDEEIDRALGLAADTNAVTPHAGSAHTSTETPAASSADTPAATSADTAALTSSDTPADTSAGTPEPSPRTRVPSRGT